MKTARFVILFLLLTAGVFITGSTVSAAPTINRITSPNPNGTYRTNDLITIFVEFSESVYTDGDLTLMLNSSSTASCAFSIASSSPAVSGSCIYTVRDGDSTNDLNVNTVSGSVFNSASNTPMTNFVPAVKLASIRELKIDTSPLPPTILSINSAKPDGVYGVGEDIQIDINFSDSVYSVGDVTLNLNTGSSCSFFIASDSPATSASCVYTTQLDDETSRLDVISVSGNIISASSTPMVNFTPVNSLASVKDISIDGVIPRLLIITTTKNNGVYKAGEEIPIILTYSEPVTITDYADLGFNSGGVCRFSVFVDATTTPSCIYTIASGENTDDLDVSGIIDIGPDFHLYDEVGNELLEFLPSNHFASDYDIVVDTIAPVATLSTLPENPTFDVNANITVGGDSVDYYMYKLDGGNWSSSVTSTITISLAGLSATTHTIYVVGRDAVGNWQSTSTPTSFSWTVAIQPVSVGGGGGGGGSYISPTTAPAPQVLGVKIYSYSSGRKVKVAGDSAVYHITDDGKRHLYVNESTYWTWHKGTWADQNIEIISQKEFDDMPEGENVTVQPDSKLIRFFNSPRVYMVSDGAEINYMNEAVLVDYYGDDWESNVIMIQNGFENDYTRGEAIVI